MERFDTKTTSVDMLKQWYRLLTLGRALDEKAPSYLLQSLGWSYHAPYAGHDGIQLAIGQTFKRGEDFLFPYYRDMLTALSAGMMVEELILNGISKATDPGSGGRHMSNHFAKPEWHIENISSATGTHDLHAAGVARAMVYYNHKGVVITSHGESSSSEEFVYEAINGASLERLPIVFVWQDNGYGISVPKKDQTAARKVADNFAGFKNLRIIHCNGKDVFDSMNAMAEARAWAIEQRCPVIVQANCVRIGSHSNSDKQTLYRDEAELAYVKEADPLPKFRRMLLRYNRLTEEELVAIEEESKQELILANRRALLAPDPLPEGIYNHVLSQPYQPTQYVDGVHTDTEGDKKFLVTALNETLKAEFRHNPDTFIWGQDVANRDKGGVFNLTKGMQQEFGAQRVFNALGAEDVEAVSVEDASEQDFLAYNRLILGVATWFDGELPSCWDEFLPALDGLDLRGKRIALFGLGNQRGYPENFADALGVLANLVEGRGATLVGFTSTEGYHFVGSGARRGSWFCGLVIDVENQSELTDERVANWCKLLKA